MPSCAVLCCVVCRAVSCVCAVLCCAALCYVCVAFCCDVLCRCAEGAVTKGQRPGCLPTGTGKREVCVCCACAVCECVYHSGKRGYALVPAALPCVGGRECAAEAHAPAPVAVPGGGGSSPRCGALVALPARRALPPPSAHALLCSGPDFLCRSPALAHCPGAVGSGLPAAYCRTA